MKKNLTIIVITVISFIALEFVGNMIWTAMKHYDRVVAQNRQLRKELRECQEKLDELENPDKVTYKIYRSMEVR